jgi:predicted nucleic acid-binding protein
VIFWDTSALVRCYSRDEPGHGRAANLLASRERQSGSVILLPETMTALARMAGSNRALRDKVLRDARSALGEFELMPADIGQAELAARFAVEHRLRGADALHVAAAWLLSRELGRSVRFVTADVEQAGAARLEKLPVILVA